GRIESGADILNVSGADQTCKIVEIIRNKYPYIPIMATGGPTDDTILETIECGADAITYTPPTNAEIFRKKMQIYREKLDSKK
ncbi:MAG: hydrolase, partial [Christensenellaceae bacterium]